MMKRRSVFFALALAATAAAFAAATPDPQSPATAKVTFRGTEYLLRSSHGNGYDFTPRGQEDLSTFTDMLELNLYPGA
jgi:polyisoprenoid-binding protein YceI